MHATIRNNTNLYAAKPYKNISNKMIKIRSTKEVRSEVSMILVLSFGNRERYIFEYIEEKLDYYD